MKCLITGVAGFIGSSLADKLLSAGHTVTGIDCFTEYYPRKNKEKNLEEALKSKNFKFIEGDLLKEDLLALVLDVDWIFHQAAQAGVRKSWGGYFSTYSNNNILATQRLLEACTKAPNIKKIVYASSSSVYGNAEAFPTPEDLLPKPVSPYGVTKLAAEHLAVLYATEFGLPTVSLRYFTVYGPRHRPDMAFYRFISSALRGKELVVFGDGEQSRDFTYIDDIVNANILAAERGVAGTVYNLGGGTQATVNEILEIIQNLTGPLKVRRIDRQIGDARHTSADTTRARSVLGFSPAVGLKDGIRSEFEWLQRCQKDGLLADLD